MDRYCFVATIGEANEMARDGWRIHSFAPDRDVAGVLFLMERQAVIVRDMRPHSRACGIIPHEHGTGCHSNCPTCGGV